MMRGRSMMMNGMRWDTLGVMHRHLASRRVIGKSRRSEEVYDEDLEKEGTRMRLARLAGLKDVTEKEKHIRDGIYRVGSGRVEEMLRRALPPEKVVEGLEEHRKYIKSMGSATEEVRGGSATEGNGKSRNVNRVMKEFGMDEDSFYIKQGGPNSLQGRSKQVYMKKLIEERDGGLPMRKSTPSRCKLKKVVGTCGFSLSEGLIEARKLVEDEKWSEAEELYLALADENLQPTVLLELAKAAHGRNEIRIAGRAAIRAYNMDSGDFNVNVFLAEFLTQVAPNQSKPARYYSIALNHAEMALSTFGDVRVVLLKAHILTLLGKFRSSCALIAPIVEKFQKISPSKEHAAFYIELAKAQAGLKRYTKCAKVLENAIQCHPENLEAHYLLAQFHHVVRRNFSEAANFLKRALNIDPEDVKILISLGRLNLDPDYESKDYSLARKSLEKALALTNGSIPDLFFDIGLAALHLSDSEAALKYFEMAHKLDPDSKRRWLGLSMMAESLSIDLNAPDDHLHKAIELYQLALDERHDDTIKLNMLKCILRTNDLHRAESLAKQILVEQHQNPQIHTIMADLLFSTDQSLQALHHSRQALTLDPHNSHALLVQGKIHLSLLEYQQAINCLQRSIECECSTLRQLTHLDPRPSDIPFAFDAYFMLGKCHSSLNDHDNAYNCYSIASSLDPKNVIVILHLAETCQSLHRDDEALQLFRTASVLQPLALRPNFHLANHLAQNQQFEQAIHYYEKVIHNMNAKFDQSTPENENDNLTSYFASQDGIDLDELAFKVYNNLATSYHHLSLLQKNNSHTLSKLSQQYQNLALTIASKIQNSNPHSPILLHLTQK